MIENYVIGLDFGTESVRCVICNAKNGEMISQADSIYKRYEKGLYCSSKDNVFRQHPLDYIDSMTECITTALAHVSDAIREQITAIGIDTTGSTPCPVDANGTPLALLEEFAENPNAMFFLWKDHSALNEAKDINENFASGDISYTKYQGEYSSEWFWSKILYAARNDSAVDKACATWVEHCDWMVAELCGDTSLENLTRCACAAGHKALYHSEWNSLPDEKNLEQLHKGLSKIAKNYNLPPKPCGALAGVISVEWSKKLNLPQNTKIAIGALDAHTGAVGAGIREKTIAMAVGTSSVCLAVARAGEVEPSKIVHTSGVAENSVIPGYIGIESGQAAFGDIFAWLKSLLLWQVTSSDIISSSDKKKLSDNILAELEKQAIIRTEESGVQFDVFATDWFNGRRYPYPNESETATISGLRLHNDAVDIYCSLVRAACFGMANIIGSLKDEGVLIERIIATGGISQKSSYIMQTISDITGLCVSVPIAQQITALGAAIYASVASGAHKDVESAQRAMCSKEIIEYRPNLSNTAIYAKALKHYRTLYNLNLTV